MAKKTSRGRRQDPDPGRQGHARAAGRHRPRSPRRADHGVLQAVQRRHRGPDGHHRAGRDHRLRGPQLHVRPEDAAHAGADPPGRSGVEKGSMTPGKAVVGHPHRRPDHRDRQGQDARPQRLRPRRRQAQVRGTARSMGIKDSARIGVQHDHQAAPGPPRPGARRKMREPSWRRERSTSTPPSASTVTSSSRPTEASVW